jgi:hypothetical protein
MPSGARSSDRPARWLPLALLPCAGYLGTELYLLGGGLGFPLDDSFIHLQFARNLAAGEGLSYNAGELVTGSTAPLWTALLSLALLLPGSALAWSKALGIVWHLASVAATWRLARELGSPRPLAAVASLLVATTGWLVWSALAAMEVPLFCTLSLLGMARHVRERRDPGAAPLALPLLALATLARPEGLLLLLLAVADRLLVLRRSGGHVGGRDGGELAVGRPPWRSMALGLLLAALALVPTMLVYQAIGGSPLPTTFSTKGGYSEPGLPQARYLFQVLGLLAQSQPVATLLAPAGVVALVARLGGRDDRGLLPGLWLLGLPFAYGVLSGGGRGIFGNFGRYFFPLLPVVAVLAVLGVGALAAEVPRRLRLGRLRVNWTLLVAALLLLPSLTALVLGAGRYGQSVVNIEDGDVRMARVLAEILPPEATLAVNDIGAMKFLLPNRIVDLAGIATPEVHAYARRSMARSRSYCPGLLEFVRHARPDYLAVFPRWHPCFSDREFPPLMRLEVEDNITLGDDEIVLHSTPWTRYPLRAAPGAPRQRAPGPRPATR